MLLDLRASPQSRKHPHASRTVRQIVTFGAIGVASTLAYVALYGSLRSVVSAMVANFLALALTAVANTAANRRLTFDVRGRAGLVADQLAGLVAFGIALAITSGAIGLLGILAPHAAVPIEMTVLVAANVAATLVRFVVLRWWIVRAHDLRQQPRVPEGVSR